jgi:fructuronate reductase
MSTRTITAPSSAGSHEEGTETLGTAVATASYPRLSQKILRALPQTVRQPLYDRGRATPGVVHLGIGAFHRAHQAVYFDDLLDRGVDGYAVVGASLRSDAVAEQLNPQDGLYGVLTLDGTRADYRVIGAVREVVVAERDPAALLGRLCAPATRIVGLTVTEKGYCHRPADGSLDVDHPDIAHDIVSAQSPRSAVGYLVRALAARFAAGLEAPTVLCCDNLPHNGRLLAGLCRTFAEAAGDPALARRIEDEVRFPCTMVDRIVPATTDADRDMAAQRYGIADGGLVKAEPFSQWVIESGADVLAPLSQVGALLVEDVSPFETIKLRMLNGVHSTLAYLGYLAGCETVDRAMQLPGMAALVAHLHTRDIAPTLRAPGDFDLETYAHALRARFANAALAHRTWQIAMDGSQKLPQRLLGTVADRLAAGADVEILALPVAAWMRYVGGIDEHGEAIDVRDPLAVKLAAISATHRGDAAATVHALLDVNDVFAPALAAAGPWRDALVGQYVRLGDIGAARTVATIAETLR